MTIFVSSTVKDLRKYRRQVETALKDASVHCQLSDDWINSYSSTVDAVRKRLHESGGYYGQSAREGRLAVPRRKALKK